MSGSPELHASVIFFLEFKNALSVCILWKQFLLPFVSSSVVIGAEMPKYNMLQFTVPNYSGPEPGELKSS